MTMGAGKIKQRLSQMTHMAHMAHIVAALACVVGGQAGAQVVPANVAVPFYTPPAFMQGVYRYWYAPQSAEFATQADTLVRAMGQLCSATATATATADDTADTATAATQRARAQWQTTVIVWDRLAAVAIGPLLQRRAMRQIDFAPTRPELIERAIVSLGQAAVGGDTKVGKLDKADHIAKAMERIGTPAKGFPALEWLLWTRPVQPGSPACHYAHQVTSDIRDEARALAQAFAALAALDASADEEAASPAMAELLNQWVGALERLRWAQMEKPLRSTGQGARKAATSAAPAPSASASASASAFPRSASGSTAPGWVAQWEAIRVMGVAGRAPMSDSVPAPGQGLVSLETYLRGRGLNPLANKLAASVGQVQQALPGATPANSTKVLAATRPLGQLKRLVEAEVAPALEVNIGFSDADGD